MLVEFHNVILQMIYPKLSQNCPHHKFKYNLTFKYLSLICNNSNFGYKVNVGSPSIVNTSIKHINVASLNAETPIIQ